MKQPLLRPYKSTNLPLRNRMVVAPMTRNRADNEGKVPTDELHGVYYEQRSSAGLIISEGSQVSERAVGYIHTPGIYSDEQVEGWKHVTRRVHNKGGKIFIQLWHVGRMSHPDYHGGGLPLAPSAINPGVKTKTPHGIKETVTPQAMTQEDIDNTISDFVRGAKNAIEAGFDGIEIHSSNGYLFHQFFSLSTNIRTDRYGGSKENRARFFFEVLDAIKKEIPELKIGVRFNPSLHGLFGIVLDVEAIPTFDYIIERCNDYDLAYIHLSEPFTNVVDNPYAIQNIAKHYRPIYKGTLIINSKFDKETGNQIIEEGLADLVAYGKLFISNPDLVERYATDAAIAPWDKETFYTQGKEGYTDYPSLR